MDLALVRDGLRRVRGSDGVYLVDERGQLLFESTPDQGLPEGLFARLAVEGAGVRSGPQSALGLGAESAPRGLAWTTLERGWLLVALVSRP